MTAAAVVFYTLASIALVAGLMVIVSRNVMHSAIYLVLAFLAVAGIYVLLTAEFVAVVQVLVYAGGIVVLFLFLIMLVNLREALGGKRVRLHAVVSGVMALLVVVQVLYVYASGGVTGPGGVATALTEGGNLQAVGWALYRDYLLPFEIASVLLLVAMIGAIVLARQKA
ncbi:MAG: NADH-quinone oxidoreductase subunit J [Candidatus Polarisedimenticolia bacterium]